MEEEVSVHKTRGEQSLNIKELFFKYVRFLPLYIISVALALFGAYMYLRYATESYRSAANIVIQDDQKTSRASNPIDIALQSETRKNIPVEIEILQSRPVMSRVVEALNLNFNYFAKGKIKELNIYKIAPFKVEAIKIRDSSRSFSLALTFSNEESFKVNGSKEGVGFGQIFKNESGEFRVVRVKPGNISTECVVTWNPTVTQAGILQSGLVVVPKQNSGILTITMEATSPELTADVINRLIKEYQAVTVETKNKTSLQQLKFINKELDSVSNQLDSINDKYVAYRNANNIIETSTQSSNLLTQIEEATKGLKQQKLQIGNALQIQDYLSYRNNSFTNVPSSLGIEDPTLNGLVTEYNRAQAERAQLLENAPEGNVVIKQKTEQLESLRSKILENVKNIKTSFGTAVGSLQTTTSAATAKSLTMPAKERGLLDIQRDLESKAVLYNLLLNKREEAAIALASTISDITILQEAAPNGIPVKPDRRSTQILAVVIGLLIPTIIIIVMELLNDKVNSRHDIERLTDTTILGEIGHSFSNNALVVTPGNRKIIAEQFRILRSNLQYLLTKAPKPVIMVTSSFSGEGKSFICINVGAVMALANKKTIVLEFDIRKPKIATGLDMPKHAGLTNFILGKVKLEELPVPVPGYENLFVLPCGPLPPNPAELLLDDRINELFTWLRENFDVIIMDTAPVGMVSDALTLSKYADCTLYIVRQGHTFKKQINLVDAFYHDGKLPNVSIVLNDVKVRPGYGYGAYGYSGYSSGYGAGYFEDEPEQKKGLSKWLNWLGNNNGSVKKT